MIQMKKFKWQIQYMNWLKLLYFEYIYIFMFIYKITVSYSVIIYIYLLNTPRWKLHIYLSEIYYLIESLLIGGASFTQTRPGGIKVQNGTGGRSRWYNGDSRETLPRVGRSTPKQPQTRTWVWIQISLKIEIINNNNNYNWSF